MGTCLLVLAAIAASPEAEPKLEWIRLSDDGRSFVLADSGRGFTPFGFNYDHDETGRLIEDYWVDEWPKVEEDFREMRALGANVVRIHLQLARFMEGPDKPNESALERLGRLLRLAESTGLYLDLTGLGCYHKKDVPAWYDALDEGERWEAQARFWEAVAKRARESPAVFSYDLMNEPVVPGGDGKRDDWLGPAFAGKHFVQFVALETRGRPRAEIARKWTQRLVAAIREHDPKRLVTVGLVPWSLDRPGLTSGFVPETIAPELDFVSVHIYPESGKLGEALETLEGFALGKPLVVEEVFPLKCTPEELGEFMQSSRALAAGWISFYWGKTLEECRKSGTLQDAILLRWLEVFREKAPEAGR